MAPWANLERLGGRWEGDGREMGGRWEGDGGMVPAFSSGWMDEPIDGVISISCNSIGRSTRKEGPKRKQLMNGPKSNFPRLLPAVNQGAICKSNACK